jgi:uncharacterized membrane-anchored protein
MDRKKFQHITACLSCYDLNGREKQFVAQVREYFMSRGHLTEQQEAILQNMYKEKLKWAKLGLITGKRAASGSRRNSRTRS